jgi:hypothetical protein
VKKRKKMASLPNHLAWLRQSFCLNTNTRIGCWRSNTRTSKTEILLLLNLEFFYVFLFFFLCLFFCVYLSTSPCWFLWFSFFSFFVLLVLLLWVS